MALYPLSLQVICRLRSEQFSGFTYTLGTVTDDFITNTFQPTSFDDYFYLEMLTNTSKCGFYKVNLSGCVDELILTGSESATMDIESNNFISSTQDIKSTANVNYRAKNTIELNPTFQVQLGAIFLAQIAACTP